MKCLINIRSFKWIIVVGWLNEELEDLWEVNLVRGFLLHRKMSDDSELL